MTTLSDIETRIFDEVKLTASTAVRNAVLSAVKWYRNHRFWFNEMALTFTATSSIAGYTLSTIISAAALPVRDVLKIDSAAISLNNRRYRLTRIPYKRYIDLDPSLVFGFPTQFTIHRGIFFFYPTPSQTFTTEVSGLWNITLTSSGSSSNVWTNEASELILTRAKADYYLNFLHDPQEAQAQWEYEKLWLNKLDEETDSRLGGVTDLEPYF